MSERSAADLRLEIAAERDGLAGDLDGLRGSLRPLVPVAAGVLIAALFLALRRRRSKRSEAPYEIPRVRLVILLVKLLWKLRGYAQRDRRLRPAPDSAVIVVVPGEPSVGRKAPWPAARPAPETASTASPAAVPGA